jgi:Skp family chaperone for outer membrane proteins
VKKFGFLILIIIFASVSFAQTKSETSIKIAIVDTNVFNDREKGIKRLVKAENSYNIEHFTEHSLSKEIKVLEKEIDLLLNQNKPINEKYVELQKLKKELENAQEEKKAEYKRKYSIIVEPVIEKIRNKLQELNKLNGYILVIDKSNGSILIEGEVEDITEEFIKFCNESFEKEKPK